MEESRIKNLIATALLLLGISMNGQSDYRPPLDIPLILSGNFGELRSSHFHTGLDIKTQQRTGLPVYAVQEGFVSRVKVSPYGYGHALYIDHPEGITTVYAHLSSYNDTITHFLRRAQYQLESFEVDLYTGHKKIHVQKGDIIGYSGNSGSSGGPHLHFEARHTESEKPINPLQFNWDIEDQVKPTIRSLKVYPIDDFSEVRGKNSVAMYDLAVTSGNARLSRKDPIQVKGRVGFAIDAFDQFSQASNHCGVYRMKMWVDGTLKYEHVMDTLDFSEKKYINAHRDFGTYLSMKRTFQRTFKLPNSEISIYRDIEDNGVLSFNEEGTHLIRFEVSDFVGNKTAFETSIIYEPLSEKGGMEVKLEDMRTEMQNLFRFDEDNLFQHRRCEVMVPAGHLFDDAPFSMEVLDEKGKFGPVLSIGDVTTPLLKDFRLSMNALDLPDSLRSKAIVVRYDPLKNREYSEGGRLEDDYLICSPSRFGHFCIAVDAIAPSISNDSFKSRMTNNKSFTFKVTDNLSGIEKIEGRIDNKWVLMDYDPKRARVTYTFDSSRLDRGDHTFVLKVSDAVGNVSEFTGEFSW